ncbi:trypsin-like peptidase domain-containing protein [Hydrogenophaga sp. IBVHS1]|uniref:trypsin-like peptidase domain-containing protein n=1 Tax=unclassified Hydrogenophaga TaxID=2610897 RepID=UPI000A2D5D55|nr:trypsin-like peptidase domain-containing protein [Hydrogenophaga sp. IBVHS1]OSZ75494.1 hypothetical protein CAP37_08870 [Hydrogenophaga sp. IBVHS1]
MKEDFLRLAEMAGRLANIVCHYVVPIYQTQQNRLTQVGTGFLVRSSAEHFLVTAAHVLDVGDASPLYFFCAPSKLRSLAGSFRCTTFDQSRDDDLIDVAVIRLEGGAVPPYHEVEKYALDLDSLQPGRVREGGAYLLVGFPSSMNKPTSHTTTLESKPWSVFGETLTDSTYAFVGISPQTHLLMKFDQKRGFNADMSPRVMNMPQGMSGAPVWMIASEHYKDPKEGPVVVALATRHKKSHKAIQGTDVGVVHEMIAEIMQSLGEKSVGTRD